MPTKQTYFADTWYWLALLNKRDDWHSDARRVAGEIGSQPIVTSHMVFDELLGRFTKENLQHLRRAAVDMIKRLQSDPTVTIIEQTPEQFTEAVDHYDKFHDKLWSLTDCASMLIMKRRHITTALTRDGHFAQASLKIRSK